VYWHLQSIFQLTLLRRRLQAKVTGRNAILIGSAPPTEANFEYLNSLNDQNVVLFTVNGSIGSLPKEKDISWMPIISIVDGELVSKNINTTKESRRLILSNGLLKDRNLGELIIARSNGSKIDDLKALCANYSSRTILNPIACRKVVDKVTGIRLFERSAQSSISRGTFVIALGLWLGVRSVRFDGFSLFIGEGKQTEYFYGSVSTNRGRKGNFDPSRNHTAADSAILAILKMRGHDISTPSPQFNHLLNNIIH
jgi:hypothetical protein